MTLVAATALPMLRRELDELLHKPEEQRHGAKQQRLPQEMHEPMARKAPAEREGFDEENRLGDDGAPTVAVVARSALRLKSLSATALVRAIM